MNKEHWYHQEPDGRFKRLWHWLERMAYDAGGKGINQSKDGNEYGSK